ncbi:MAG: STT3 domain-containing protein [Candidatus Altiarchaeota archaeon]
MASKKRRIQSEEASIDIPLGWLGDLINEPLFLSSFFCLAIAVAKTLARGTQVSFLYDVAPFALFALFIWSSYTLYTRPNLRKNIWTYGMPALILLTALFSYYSNNYGFPMNEDYSYFSIMAAIFCMFYALSYYKIIDAESSMLLALFASALLIHLVPANADILSNLDSYWHYKWMQVFYNDGIQPEFDPLTYPMYGGLAHLNNPSYASSLNVPTFGLDQKNTPMLMQMTYASLALTLKPLGISLYDVAMLFPGILGAFSVVLMYLLVKEMFSDMRPHNNIAAFAAAFMFMLSPALAMNSTATNCEDDSFGMFLMVGVLFLFFASYHRKSFKYSVYCGVALLMLRLGWGGGQYAVMTLGIFGTLYAIVRFLRNTNAMEHLPYIIIPFMFYQLSAFIVHETGGMPIYVPMAPLELYPLMSTVGLSLTLEFLRVRSKGMQFVNDGTVEGQVVDLIERNIMVLGAIAILLGAASLVFYKTPSQWIDFTVRTVLSPEVKSIVHQTVAEQNPMATSVDEFISEGYNRYGIALLFGLLMIPVMLYLIYRHGSVGALFLLTWSIPMMWGAYNKSAWIFASSASVTALGATIGLFSAARKSELDGFRVVGTILVLCIPLLYVPMIGSAMYQKFVGYVVMHMGPTSDIYYWTPALEWHRDHTKQGDAIITWWDYGHWLTAVSHRPVLIDNLQADYLEIQDVARFFVNKTSEEDAFKTVEAYNQAYKKYNPEWGLNYAMVDWTMIGKGSALHYIATGDIANVTPGSWKNYVQCGFLPDQSQLEEKLTVEKDGSFSKNMRIAFGCQNQLFILFDISGGQLKAANVVTGYGNIIPWSTWSAANDASLLGVQPLISSPDDKVPGILQCAINWRKLPAGSICRLPQFTTLVYVPQEFNDFMLTRLYLGKYLQEYKDRGFYNREVVPLKHFREVPDINGDGVEDGEFSWGFVRTYEINYEGFPTTDAVLTEQPENTTT